VTGPDPAEYAWWLASRAAGVVALLCITLSVGLGLAMAGRVSRGPALARTLLSLHRQTALVGLVAIAVHGITLLGDRFLSPSIGDIALPFTSSYAPVWTGLGVTAGWLGAILGLSYWIRDRVGAQLWRRLHRATILVYVLSVAHAIGAGTDASEPWMRALVITTGAPILFLFTVRVLTPRAGPAFRRYRVVEVTPESSAVCSFALVPVRRRLAAHAPGQFVTVRSGDLARSYSLSSVARDGRLRISVKREPGGRMSEHLHAALDIGSTVEVAGPTGAFALPEHRTRPVVLVSAGIGATPLLAMLEELAAAGSRREVWWVHGARNGREHAFRAEVRRLLERLPNAFAHVRYSRPDARDVAGRDYDAHGRVTPDTLRDLPLPADADFRICGPTDFVAALASDLDPARVQSESFGTAQPQGGSDPLTRGGSDPRSADGPAVGFARSGVTARWEPGHASLLELAEAHGVPAASGCRVGACQGCRAGVLEGTVRHDPEPLAAAPPGSALLCCAVPEGDVLIDA
jgi:ferredoxin-NADP reductase/DMSO/TMAO reductase YedYZ heme-binding membrane subunit